jgi:hypothetical protein
VQAVRAAAVSDYDELSNIAVAAGRPLGIPGAYRTAEWAHPCWPDLRELLAPPVQAGTPYGYVYEAPGTPTADKPVSSVSADNDDGCTVDIWHTVAGKAAVIRIMALHGYAPCGEYAPTRDDGLVETSWRWIG